MSMDRRYQSALRGKEPSAAWRRRTLEAMEGAKGKKARPRRANIVQSAKFSPRARQNAK